MMIGFIAGASYVVACGGSGASSTLAAILGAAADVTYGNTSSGLTATDTQAAIDEVETRVDALEAPISDTETLLAGSWSGDTYYSNECSAANCSVSDTALTLNTNGSYTCSGTGISGYSSMLSSSHSFCTNPGSWEVLIQSIKLTDDSGNFMVFHISSLSQEQLELTYHNGATLVLTKN